LSFELGRLISKAAAQTAAAKLAAAKEQVDCCRLKCMRCQANARMCVCMRPHLAVGLDAMLQAVKLPARVADLATGLADVDGENLTHGCCVVVGRGKDKGLETLRDSRTSAGDT